VIRRKLTRFIERKMFIQGVTAIHYADILGDNPRCTLVNPACPDDLCILPAGHVGTEEKVHILGTDRYSEAVRYDFPMAPPGTDDEELVRLGWEEQFRRFPDQRPPYRKSFLT
jgi:hypothetical protein